MKRILIFILVFTGGVVWPGFAFSWGSGGESWDSWESKERGNSWQDWEDRGNWKAENKQGKSAGKDGEKKYCSGKQEKELLELLKELDKPFANVKKMRGGRSEARWKYKIIRKLRKFDDCRAEDALKRLSEENICEEGGEGDVFCVKWAADPALQEIKAAADLKKLVAATPMDEQLKIIRKYTRRPYKNNFAANMVAEYLVKQSMKKPEIFVPLLVELFPHKPKTEVIARRNPEPANKGLEKILAAEQFDQVWWGISLARYLGKKELLGLIYDIAFGKKGNIDYTRQAQVEEIKTAARGFFRALEPDSAVYIKRASAVATSAFSDYCSSAAKGCKTSLSINRYLTDLADNSSGFAVAASIGNTLGSGGTADDGKEIIAILITENASWENDRGKPTVIITGAIHGNEWATPEVCLGIASYLLANRDNAEPARDDKGAFINEKADSAAAFTPELTSINELLKTIQVVIIPVLNPDGYDYSHTPAGEKSYYGTGWRPNRRAKAMLDKEEVCYRKDGTPYPDHPANTEHCFLADYDDTDSGGELEEEEVIVCESVDRKTLSLFESSLNVASTEMFDAIYDSTEPPRAVCASGQRRVWKEKWLADGQESVDLAAARADGYLQDSYGVDLNRNFQYKWDVTRNQKHLFIRNRSPSSRMYRGRGSISEGETSAMERLIAKKNVVALIDYHAGSTQVLHPYAFSTSERTNEDFLGGKWGKDDYEVFRLVSEKIASLLNRHDRGDQSIVNYTAAQNYNDVSVGSGVARDCYYQTEGIAALSIEVHDKRYTYEHEEFRKIVPEICKTSVPGAIWFLFWAAELDGRQKKETKTLDLTP